MTKGTVRGVAVVAVLGLLTTACTKSSSSVVPPPATSAAGGSGTESSGVTPALDIPAANNKGTASVAGLKSFAIEADTDGGVNYFNATVLTGTPGQTITLKVKDVSTTVPHNFSLTEQNLNVDLDPGATKSIKVTFPDSGVLQFHCEYHVDSGMIGALQVA